MLLAKYELKTPLANLMRQAFWNLVGKWAGTLENDPNHDANERKAENGPR